jgi:purine-nucleoside phosphorylase
MPHLSPKLTILVPQGAEYQAVLRGLKRVNNSTPTIMAIPVGIKPLNTYLHKLPEQHQLLNTQMKVLLMGLCGSLNPSYSVGDVVLYQDCVYQNNCQECDRSFTKEMKLRVSDNVTLVKSLTSDRVISTTVEKRHLGEKFGADVVDMEGFAALDFFDKFGVPIAMLRVVSDDCHHDIPDLTSAISADGTLKSLPLALELIRQPIAATRLIRGSLRGLKALEEVTKSLFA